MKCMKDYLFADFEKWFNGRTKLWESMGLTISKISYIKTPIHSYRISFSAEIRYMSQMVFTGLILRHGMVYQTSYIW